MKKCREDLMLRVMGAVLLAGLTFAPQAYAADVPTEIKIGTLYASSGRYASISMPVYSALKLWADQKNADGGVYVKAFEKKAPVRLGADRASGGDRARPQDVPVRPDRNRRQLFLQGQSLYRADGRPGLDRLAKTRCGFHFTRWAGPRDQENRDSLLDQRVHRHPGQCLPQIRQGLRGAH